MKALRRLAAGLTVTLALALAPLPAAAWSFAVCGDSRGDVNGIFPRIVAAVQKSDAELLVHTGDLESPGGEANWTAFKGKLAPLKKPFVVAIGNHEIWKASRADFVRFFGLPGPSYAVDHRDARFLVLDTADGSLPDAQLAWLKRELTAHPKGKDGVEYLVVVSHYPPVLPLFPPHGTRGPYEEQSRKLHGLLVRHKVDLFLCGHEHLHLAYDWDSVKVIITGGAGAPLVPLYDYGYYRVELSGGKAKETLVTVPK